MKHYALYYPDSKKIIGCMSEKDLLRQGSDTLEQILLIELQSNEYLLPQDMWNHKTILQRPKYRAKTKTILDLKVDK